MNKCRKLFIYTYAMFFVLFITSGLSVSATEGEDVAKDQILFVLDASKSMEKDGRWGSVVDSILLMAAALPDSYESGILVYNTDTEMIAGFGEIGTDTRDKLFHIERNGYTNPADALQTAIDMFSKNDTQKRVVFFSDGEISMKNEEETLEAAENYKKEITHAINENIRIDAFLFPDEKTENQISDGVDRTSGSILTQGIGKSVESLAAEYLFEILQVKRTDLGVSDTEGGNLQIDLQDHYMQAARIIVIADTEIESIHIRGQCRKLNITEGKKSAVVRLTDPLQKEVLLDYTLKEKGTVHTFLIKEYKLNIKADRLCHSENGRFRVEADLRNHLDQSILDMESVCDAVSILIDGEETDYIVENGKAVWRYQTDHTRDIMVSVDMSRMDGIIYCEEPEYMVRLAVPAPVMMREPDYTVLWAVLAALLTVIVLLIVVFETKNIKKKRLREEEKKKSEPAVFFGYEFSGQITLYLLKGGQEDLPPCSIKLFGSEKKSFSFRWVMEQCGMTSDLQGADKIKFTGGPDHALCLKNIGSATIMKGSQMLTGEKKYFLRYGEKILLVFHNGDVELELHYKNMRQSER